MESRVFTTFPPKEKGISSFWVSIYLHRTIYFPSLIRFLASLCSFKHVLWQRQERPCVWSGMESRLYRFLCSIWLYPNLNACSVYCVLFKLSLTSTYWTSTLITPASCTCSVMPSKATLFNCKCEAVYDFGSGHRNLACFNPQGNNILLRSLCHAT